MANEITILTIKCINQFYYAKVLIKYCKDEEELFKKLNLEIVYTMWGLSLEKEKVIRRLFGTKFEDTKILFGTGQFLFKTK